MRKIRIFVSSIVLSTLISCSTSNGPERRPPASIPYWEITYESGYCFGSCPVFKLHVNSRGRVRYKGINNVPAPLRRTWILQADDLQALLALVANSKIFDAPDIFNLYGAGCHNPATDLPEISISYRVGGDQHKLTHSHGCMTCKEYTDTFGMDMLRDRSQCAHDTELNRLYYFEGNFEQLIFSRQPDLAASAMNYFGDDVPLNQTR